MGREGGQVGGRGPGQRLWKDGRDAKPPVAEGNRSVIMNMIRGACCVCHVQRRPAGGARQILTPSLSDVEMAVPTAQMRPLRHRIQWLQLAKARGESPF